MTGATTAGDLRVFGGAHRDAPETSGVNVAPGQDEASAAPWTSRWT